MRLSVASVVLHAAVAACSTAPLSDHCCTMCVRRPACVQVFVSVSAADLRAFERYVAQLKMFYNDYR